VNPVTNNNPKMAATRDAYGKTLAELGKERSDIVVLDADLSGSTKTRIFADAFPERFFNVGVAEQNLVGMAAGFAQAGLTPFASSFAMFLSGRAWEVVRNTVAYPKLNVKLVATHGGITVGEDGGSHQAIEDLAIMRAIPDMTVILPSDYEETCQVIRAIADFKGPVYVRAGRSAIPVLSRDPSYRFTIGKGEVRRDGADVTFISAGIMTDEADKAADILKNEGISAAVINMASIKPLDNPLVIEYAKKTGCIVTSEEHNIIGGLGSAVAECVSENHPVPVLRNGVRDVFGQSGTSDDLLKYYKLNAEELVRLAREAIALKKKS
jgi:transketolase